MGIVDCGSAFWAERLISIAFDEIGGGISKEMLDVAQ